MEDRNFEGLFTLEAMERLFPSDRADRFFDALYGDAAEGAFDINLVFRGKEDNALRFEFHLKQRPGKCLVCNLTYGLPEVFSRHPVIGVEALTEEIDSLMNGQARCGRWRFGMTRETSGEWHIVPFVIDLER